MEKVFDSLVQILGKRDDDPAVIALLTMLGEPSRTIDIPGGHKISEFDEIRVWNNIRFER
jgi:hypothetical protein